MIDNELNMLIRDCKPKQQVNPTIAIIKNGSVIFKSLSRNLMIIISINDIIKAQKINPNSSPATAKIKSVFASGIFSLSIPCHGPFPNNPPDLKAFKLRSI